MLQRQVLAHASRVSERGLLVLLAISLAAQPAEVPRAELVYVRAAGAEACTVEALKESVSLRLGYDPFVPHHRTQVIVQLSAGAAGLSGRVQLVRDGAPTSERVVSGSRDCQGLTQALALTVSLAIDPLMLTRPAPPAPTPAPAPRAPEPAPAPPAEPSRELKVSAAVAASLELGLHPNSLFGARTLARFGGARFSLAAGGWVTVPTRLRVESSAFVETFSAGGELGGCAQLWLLSACVLGRAGALRYEGMALFEARRGWLPMALVGPRIGVEWPASSPVAVYAAAELWVPLVHNRIVVTDASVWEQARILGGVALGARFQLK